MSEENNTEESKAEETIFDQKELLEGLFGGLGGEAKNEEMISKHAQAMVEEFNGMLTQILFDLVVQSYEEDKQSEIKGAIYSAWKNRMHGALAESKASAVEDTGLDAMFDVTDILEKSIDKAEVVIKDFLGINDAG